MNPKKRDMEKQRYWRTTIGEAARSGMSIREFCQQRRLKESQFYWWQRKLKASRQERRMVSPVDRGGASFALVSDEVGNIPAGLELVLRDGRRLRISKGVEEKTLRAVLAAVES
jgi:transposase